MLCLTSCTLTNSSLPPIFGEHLNGVEWQYYSGPATIQQSYLNQIFSAIENHAKESSDDFLQKIIDNNRDKSWTRDDLVYLTSNSNIKSPVGVCYEIGRLQCVIYQNQAKISFMVEYGENEGENIYYISLGKMPKVTHAYILAAQPMFINF